MAKRKLEPLFDEEFKKLKEDEQQLVFKLKNNKELKLNKTLCNKYYNHYEYSITDLTDIIALGEFYHNKDYDKSKHTNIPFYTIYKLKSPIEKLLNMIGLNSLKKEILSLIVYYLQQFDSENQDMLHTVVYGGPGVGKTKFINILSEIYAYLGVLPTKKVTFAKRADLVGQYLGQTAIKTKDLLENARGGILVIDEAYSLGDTEQRDSFSRECIDTINQYLSENKKDLVCVIAGYKEDLDKRFFKTNPGLERRFPFKFTIPDYSPKELKDIFYTIVKENGWDIEKDAISESLMKENRQCFEFNGGDMETLFTRTKFIHSMRVFSCSKKEKKKISKEDFEQALKEFTNTDTQKNKKDKEDFIKSLYI
jgi:SpoVK/Ycf46/Vps4 family AAA+-type ATPase